MYGELCDQCDYPRLFDDFGELIDQAREVLEKLDPCPSCGRPQKELHAAHCLLPKLREVRER